jgi:hypothetical protein
MTESTTSNPTGADRTRCFVCGLPAESLEHVIPKWLQHRFGLWNEELRLPNETTIRYRQLTIPACKKCNSEIFSALEQRVQQGTASDSDIWKWANKIHYGLGLKDRFLEWDRQHPGYKIGEIVKSHDPLERDRHFLHSVAGGFKTDPDPFGSVFRFDFGEPQPFRLAHLPHFHSLCISIGATGFIVFITDGQGLRRDRATMTVFNSLPSASNVNDMLFFYAQNLEHLSRHQVGFDVIMTPGLIARLGRTVVHRVEPPNKERFRYFCKQLGLEWIDIEA